MKISILFFLTVLFLSEIFLAFSIGSTPSVSNKIEPILAKKIKNPKEKVKAIVWIDRKKLSSNALAKVKAMGKIRYKYDIIPAIAIELPASQLENLAEQDFVKKIVSDKKVKTFRTESIPLIKANLTRNTFGLNGTNVTIAVIDTGIFNHTEFQTPNRIIGQKCFCSGCCPPNNVDENNNATDDNGHGTHVAGIVAGEGDSNGEGVAINVSLLAVKVLDSGGFGSDSDVVAGINWAVNSGADIISLSLGVNYTQFDNCYDVGSSIAVDNATDLGVVVVVAAGNEGPTNETISAPACAKRVITVGATDDTDSIASFSSRGSTKDNRTKPDLTAPGVSITSTYHTSPTAYTTVSGTSQATPHVSGVVSLVIQKYKQIFGHSPDPDRVKAILLTAVNITKMNSDNYTQRNNVYGAGRIDAYEAIRIMNFTKNDTISSGQEKFHLLDVVNNSLKVTLYWPENSTINNNLDLTVQAPNATNYSYPTDANDTIEQVFLNGTDSGVWKIFVKAVNVYGSQKYFVAADAAFTNDTQAPQWSNQNSNATTLEVGEAIKLYTYWTDDIGLNYAILSTNETGSWQNKTTYTLSLAGNESWSNFTWQNASITTNNTVIAWKIYANDTSNNQNVTNEKTFTIQDTSKAQYSGLTTYPTSPVAYVHGQTYQFNSTWGDSAGISKVIFEWNASNTTVETYSRDEYYTNKTDLVVGNYTYRWYANDTNDNWNFTALQTYNVTRATPPIYLALNGTENNRTYVYPDVVNATGWKDSSEGNLTLYRNGTEVAAGQIPNETVLLTVGSYNYTLEYIATQNYSSESKTFFAFVNKGPTLTSLWLNGTEGDKIYTNETIANITAAVNITGKNVTIEANFTGSIEVIANGTTPQTNFTNTSNLNTGAYNITAYFVSEENYTNSTQTYYMGICPVCSSCSDWSSCSNGQQARTCYRCDASTGYECQSYTDTQSCSVPVPSGLTGTSLTITETPVVLEDEETVTLSLSASESITLNISKAELRVTQIVIDAKNDINNAQVTIKKLDSKPDDIVEDLPGKVYRYLNITKKNITDKDLSKLLIKFKVENSWIVSNFVNPVINLSRYNNSWKKLPTLELSKDQNYTYYESESPGFSYFAISGEEISVPTPPPTPPSCVEDWSCSEWSKCIEGIQTRTCTDLNDCGTEEDKPVESQTCEVAPLIQPFVWLIVVFVVIVIVIFIVHKYKMY